MELKEYQKHIIEELVEEIFDHLSDVKHIEECDKIDKTSKEDLDLYNAQKAFKHTKFLKEFLKDIQNCLN